MPVVSITTPSSFRPSSFILSESPLEHDHEVLPDSAAEAAVHHLNDLLFSLHTCILGDQRVIDADLSKLVLDDGELLAVVGGEEMVEKRRLAAAEEAGEHGHRHARVG